MNDIDELLSRIRTELGQGSIMRLGEEKRKSIDVLPTGIVKLDIAMGIGGLPRGRIIEIYGPESSGKSVLALKAIAEVQRRGGQTALIDAEHNLNITYASKAGVSVNYLLLSQPDTAEEAMTIMEALVESNAIDLIVLDSVAALSPKIEVEGKMGENDSYLQSTLLSQFLAKISQKLQRSKTTILLINQLRTVPRSLGKNKEITLGGRSVRFYSTIRLETSIIDTIRYDGKEIGQKMNVKVVKNKLAPIFDDATIHIYYGEGVSSEMSLIETALEFGILKMNGSWIFHGTNKIAQGKEATRRYLENNFTFSEVLHTEIKKHYFKENKQF